MTSRRDSSPPRVLIVGATSAIARAVARRFAARQADFVLVGRQRERLEAVAADLRTRGAGRIESLVLDASDPASHDQLVSSAQAALGGLDVALIAHGTLPDQQRCNASAAEALDALRVNGTSVISLLARLAPVFESQGSGTIAAISSVAGDRGRQSNYAYGAAKAMVSVFMQGLRNRLAGQGVQVLTVKPGLVDTPMTASFRKGLLWSTPNRVGADIVRAIDRRKDVLYTPWFWRFAMMVIRAIPEPIFKRLKL